MPTRTYLRNRSKRKPNFALVVRHDPRVIRDMIEQAGSGYGAVAFVKKDGSPRRLVFQRGNDAAYCANTERGQRASETFARNNRNMMRLRDVHVAAREGGNKAWRTVDLERVYSVRVNGVTISFI